jgi:hypothetical protein
VWRFFAAEGISLKKSGTLPSKRGLTSLRRARLGQKTGLDPVRLVFIDETGTGIACSWATAGLYP